VLLNRHPEVLAHITDTDLGLMRVSVPRFVRD
jgi:hypothetical protein